MMFQSPTELLLFFLFALPLLLYGLHFIITEELPDMEGDQRVDKKTFIVRYGRQVGMWTSGVLVGLGTFYFTLVHFLIPLSESIDLRVIALLSLIPLGITLAILIRMRQATISAVTLGYANISGVVAFLLLLNVYLLFLL